MTRCDHTGMHKQISFVTAKMYLDKLKGVLYIKIPNGVKSFALFNAVQDIVDGGCFIDAEDDSRRVEHEEHEDGEDKNQGKIGIGRLMLQSSLNRFVV